MDCIGFVARAAKYSGNSYQWAGDAAQWNTVGNGYSDLSASFNGAQRGTVQVSSLNQATRALTYPDSKTSIIMLDGSTLAGSLLVNKAGAKNDSTADDATTHLFQELLPGDVIFYSNAHIGFIQSVDSITPGMSYTSLANALHIVESTFYGAINYAVTDMTGSQDTKFLPEFITGPRSLGETLYIARLQ